MKVKEYRKHLADMFAGLLEEKQLEWKKEWALKNVPINGKTGKPYKGINRFYLTGIAAERGYGDPRWMTFYQVKKEGLKLNNAKGQGVNVEYWFLYDTEEKKTISWQEFYQTGEQIGDRYQLRAKYHIVFNADLIEGIKPYNQKAQSIEVDELVQTLSKNMNVPILNDGGDQCFYRASEDVIHMPFPGNFDSTYAYNSTVLHELTHATGAANRLDRNMVGRPGSQEYAFEELIAEISSCFMSTHLRAVQDDYHLENHKAYVQGWARTIRKQPDVLIRAIQQAEKATTYMECKAGILQNEKLDEIERASIQVDEKDVFNNDLIEEQGDIGEIKLNTKRRQKRR